MGRLFSGLVVRAARRPLLTLGLLGLLGIGCAVAALSLRPTAATDTLVGSSSSTYKETQSFYKHFGEEPVEVLVKGDLRKLVLSSDIDRLVGLEGCMSPSLPAAALPQEGGAGGPCGQLERSKAVKVVFGPGTFLNEAAVWVDEALASRSAQAEAQARQAQSAISRKALASGLGATQATALGEEARRATMAGFAAEVSALSIRYGLTSAPSLDDHEFVSKVVFDPSKPSGTPNERFAYLFPSREAALVSIRLRAGLSEAQRSHAIGADPPGGGYEPVAPAKRRVLSGDGRASDRQRRDKLDLALDRAVAGCGVAGDGARPGSRLQGTSAPAAAGDRDAGRGVHVRRAWRFRAPR